MKKQSESFVKGAIALVFAVLGYQTALLVHYAAVTKIAADRDCPDTVYVCRTVPGDGCRDERRETPDTCRSRRMVSGNSSGNFSVKEVAERHNAPHSPIVETVRRKTRRTESFPFDPNTVSEDDLCRLGFSQKQSAAIVNYRKKGGRFRRRSDFAKSFAVSDSIYSRLEKYIVIPKIDLNEADSAAFDSLPGIGGYFARKIVGYRNRLGGFTTSAQLMDLSGFDEEKFAALKDLVEVKSPYRFLLWTAPEDSLKRHPYIGNARTARSIVFFREHNASEDLSVANLVKAGILSREAAEKLSVCIGD